MPIDDYTTEQQHKIRNKSYKLNRTGHPEVVARINYYVSEDEPFSKIQQLWEPKTVKAEIPTSEPVTEHPPFTGKGSGAVPWRAFAKTTSDMDHETIDAMSKTDLITVLKDKGVITD